MYLLLLSVFLSFFSTSIMSCLALGIEITFWVAPIVSLAVIVLFLQMIIRTKNIQDDATIIFSAGAIGGMVGLSVCFSWPTLYFLHKNVFLSWIEFPLMFSAMIGLLIIAAGSLALLLAHGLRQYFTRYESAKFPTVDLVKAMIYPNDESSFAAMVVGLLASFAWSCIAVLFRASLKGFWLLQAHTAPTLISMGFVAGHLISWPLFIGMGLRFVTLFGLRDYVWPEITEDDFMLTFSLGVLLSLICLSVYALVKKTLYWLYNQNQKLNLFSLRFFFKNMRMAIFAIFTIVVCLMAFQSWHITFLQALYLLFSVSIATTIIAYVFAEVGVLDLPNFGSFIVVPFFYFFSVSAESALIAFVFCTICMGMVVTLLFSWRLSVLTSISYERLLRYQLLGFVVAVISIGMLIWWYVTFLKLGDKSLFSDQALLQERFITLTIQGNGILLLGFLSGTVLYLLVADVSIVIAGCMMSFSVVMWLVAAGFLAKFIKNRERFYPVCFGMYASHAIWLFIQSLLL